MKCHGSFSRSSAVKSGIRQGAILSPYLFRPNTDINGLLFSLQSSDLGCHIGCEYIGCMAYTDDVIIISASIIQLQAMLGTMCAFWG